MTNAEIAARVRPQFREEMSQMEYNTRLRKIRQMAIPYERRKPKRPTRNEVGDYYGMVISEVLRSIRAGETDYVFTEEQLIDLLRYEPQTAVAYKPELQMWEVCRQRRKVC